MKNAEGGSALVQFKPGPVGWCFALSHSYSAYPGKVGSVRSSEEENRLVAYALRHPRGRYVVERASHLSGIPRSTLYDWRREGVYVPDYAGASPAAWSYRDLVLLRLMAWLRQIGMPRPNAAERVSAIRSRASDGLEVRHIRATRETLLINDDSEDQFGGPSLLPFEDLRSLLATFDLLDPVKELQGAGSQRIRLWAPDLVTPSHFTFISPWVMAGDPCVVQTRIPSASIFALRQDRGLSAKKITALYPGLTVAAAEDAYLLEQRFRGHDLPEPAAA